MKSAWSWILAWVCAAGVAGGAELPVVAQTPGSDWIDVKAAGAVGDGKADDTEALKKVFAAVTDGTVLYFPPGVYRVRETLVIEKKPPFAGKERRILGTGIYGHGRDSVLLWDGAEGGTLVRDRGMLHCRMAGLVFDGQGKADIGLDHDNNNNFETHLYYEHVAFRDFRRHGVRFVNNKEDGLSTAETAFVRSVFERCGTGVAFTSFNDYNFTFDGCHFIGNARMAVECVNGNFYVRNSRFEANALDIFANPEHGSSVRRSVSVGSGTFLRFGNSVSPMQVESTRVADWTDAHAIESRGAPLVLFDNVFEHAKTDRIPLKADGAQRLLLANNRLDGPAKLSAGTPPQAKTLELPAPERSTVPAKDATFLADARPAPERLFDVKRDFDAKGDGRADDTEALQRALDAAKETGNGAMAYLPKGAYRITRPLTMAGGGYGLLGGGLYAEVLFDGPDEADAVVVKPEGALRLENFSVKRKGLVLRDRRPEGFAGSGADIRQHPSAAGSRVVYHSVYVAGKYSHMPFLLGFRLENLGAKDLVVLDNVEGNIHAIDSGAATIYAPVSYEGTVWIKGRGRGGFFGMQTRLATLSEYSLYVEDSQSFVSSDFYIEQALPNTVTLKGNADDPPGRVTLGLPKFDINRADADNPEDMLLVDGYAGSVAISAQLYPPKFPALFRIKGDRTTMAMWGSYFYVKRFGLDPAGYPLALLASSGNSEWNDAVTHLPGVNDESAAVTRALLDLRTLGLLDWQVNYPHLP